MFEKLNTSMYKGQGQGHEISHCDLHASLDRAYESVAGISRQL